MFDFGGVIVDLDQRRCEESFIRLGVRDIGQYIDKYCQNGLFRELELGTVKIEDFHDAVRGLCGFGVRDEDIDRAWCDFLIDIPSYRLEFIKNLKKEGHRVILLSNSNAIHYSKWIQPYFDRLGGMDLFFDAVYFSHQLHLAKPNANIFQYVLKKEDERAENILFLDDGAQNIEMARSIGFKTHLVKEREDWRNYVKGQMHGDS